MTISIILSTRGRIESLRQVLTALDKMNLRSGWHTELLLVDNGSDEDEAALLRNMTLANMQVRYLKETRKGKGYALNTGLEEARGDVLLFLDDDTIPAEDWAECIVSALLNRDCEAVTGETTIASYLERPWLTSSHRWWLASSHDAQPNRDSRELIGANMGFKRSVLERVPAFDPELGPGALGLGEDTLFGWQLVEAGFKIGYASDARVSHQPDILRLTRGSWLNEARKHGKSEAYLRYHWEHLDIRYPRLRQLYHSAKLHFRRILQRPASHDMEECALWEMSYVLHIEMCKQFRLERRRARNYARRGLARLCFSENATRKVRLHCAESAT